MIGSLGADDVLILDWAEDNRRDLITHDGRTMPRHVGDRLAASSHLPGLFIVDDLAPIGMCIEDLLLINECSDEGEARFITYRLSKLPILDRIQEHAVKSFLFRRA